MTGRVAAGRALREGLDRALGIALPALLGLAVVNVCWQVMARHLLGAPSGFTDELARYLLVWVGLLGAAHAVGRGAHVALDLLPGRAERVAAGLANAALLVFGGVVMGGGGARLVATAQELGQRSAALGLPMAVVYAAVPVAGGVIAAYAAAALAEGSPGERR